MDLGSTLTLIFGTGVVTSILTLGLTYIINRKQKETEREMEHTDEIIAEVFSPMSFHFFEVENYLRISENKFSNFFQNIGSEQNDRILIQALKKHCGLFNSDSIHEHLIGKDRFC